jgi:opacity protein-like surface antigen
MSVDMAGVAFDDLYIIWRVALGASYEIDKNLSIDLAYRYVNFGSALHLYDEPYAGKEEWYMSGHEIALGARWTL